VIDAPSSLDPAAVLSESNVEVRQVMIERIGYERFLSGLNAQPVAADDYGRLWRVELPEDEPLVLVELENATVEQDGTRKRYFLRVPLEITSPQAAVAWTFDVDAGEYAPCSKADPTRTLEFRELSEAPAGLRFRCSNRI
jgi:hypothetical protein